MNRFILPLGGFLLLVFFLWRGLDLDPRKLPSTLIDKPAPEFNLRQVQNPAQWVSQSTLSGKVWLLNVWASWCVACLEEHPVITRLAKHVDIVGLNYKDQRSDAISWLSQHGNPYKLSGHDQNGDVGIDYGVYGVPETFVVDHRGHIRFKHVGPVTEATMDQVILPIVEQLRQSVN